MRRKEFGNYKTAECPFCKKQAFAKNSQGIPVCLKHKKSQFPTLRCACGSTLDIKQGKWGPFCVCINCGSMNFKKALEINDL